MGADYLQRENNLSKEDYVDIGIGDGTQITGAIIDKNARIGRGVTIMSFPPGTDIDGENWYVRDGIVVIPKNAVVKHGTYIGPERKPPVPQP